MARTPKVGDVEILREIALSEHPVITAGDLADELDYSDDGVRNRLRDLRDKGYVNSLDVGARATVWWLTEVGRSQL